jgi:hypothetical protein
VEMAILTLLKIKVVVKLIYNKIHNNKTNWINKVLKEEINQAQYINKILEENQNNFNI